MVGVATLDRRLPVILLVEDEALVRMLAAEVLSEAGFTIIESGSAEEALTVLQTRSDVRVLFTDVNMPGALDGLGLAQIVHERAPDVSILIGSGRIRPSPGELPPGVRFIAKPYASSTLTEAVCALVQGHREWRVTSTSPATLP
jgi:two-component system, response regulator PdtaR